MFSYKLSENESPIRFLRQNPAVLFWNFFLVIFVNLCLVWYFLQFSLFAENIKLFFLLWAICFLFLSYKTLLWFLQIVLVTDQKLVILSYKNIFSRKTVELPFLLISSISSPKKNFWTLFFDLHSLEVKLAGNPEIFQLKNLANATETEKLLKLLLNRFKNA